MFKKCQGSHPQFTILVDWCWLHSIYPNSHILVLVGYAYPSFFFYSGGAHINKKHWDSWFIRLNLSKWITMLVLSMGISPSCLDCCVSMGQPHQRGDGFTVNQRMGTAFITEVWISRGMTWKILEAARDFKPGEEGGSKKNNIYIYICFFASPHDCEQHQSLLRSLESLEWWGWHNTLD